MVKRRAKLGAHTWNAMMWEVGAQTSQFQDQPELKSVTLSEKKQNENRKYNTHTFKLPGITCRKGGEPQFSRHPFISHLIH